MFAPDSGFGGQGANHNSFSDYGPSQNNAEKENEPLFGETSSTGELDFSFRPPRVSQNEPLRMTYESSRTVPTPVRRSSSAGSRRRGTPKRNGPASVPARSKLRLHIPDDDNLSVRSESELSEPRKPPSPLRGSQPAGAFHTWIPARNLAVERMESPLFRSRARRSDGNDPTFGFSEGEPADQSMMRSLEHEFHAQTEEEQDPFGAVGPALTAVADSQELFHSSPEPSLANDLFGTGHQSLQLTPARGASQSIGPQDVSSTLSLAASVLTPERRRSGSSSMMPLPSVASPTLRQHPPKRRLSLSGSSSDAYNRLPPPPFPSQSGLESFSSPSLGPASPLGLSGRKSPSAFGGAVVPSISSSSSALMPSDVPRTQSMLETVQLIDQTLWGFQQATGQPEERDRQTNSAITSSSPSIASSRTNLPADAMNELLLRLKSELINTHQQLVASQHAQNRMHTELYALNAELQETRGSLSSFANDNLLLYSKLEEKNQQIQEKSDYVTHLMRKAGVIIQEREQKAIHIASQATQATQNLQMKLEEEAAERTRLNERLLQMQAAQTELLRKLDTLEKSNLALSQGSHGGGANQLGKGGESDANGYGTANLSSTSNSMASKNFEASLGSLSSTSREQLPSVGGERSVTDEGQKEGSLDTLFDGPPPAEDAIKKPVTTSSDLGQALVADTRPIPPVTAVQKRRGIFIGWTGLIGVFLVALLSLFLPLILPSEYVPEQLRQVSDQTLPPLLSVLENSVAGVKEAVKSIEWSELSSSLSAFELTSGQPKSNVDSIEKYSEEKGAEVQVADSSTVPHKEGTDLEEQTPRESSTGPSRPAEDPKVGRAREWQLHWPSQAARLQNTEKDRRPSETPREEKESSLLDSPERDTQLQVMEEEDEVPSGTSQGPSVDKDIEGHVPVDAWHHESTAEAAADRAVQEEKYEQPERGLAGAVEVQTRMALSQEPSPLTHRESHTEQEEIRAEEVGTGMKDREEEETAAVVVSEEETQKGDIAKGESRREVDEEPGDNPAVIGAEVEKGVAEEEDETASPPSSSFGSLLDMEGLLQGIKEQLLGENNEPPPFLPESSPSLSHAPLPVEDSNSSPSAGEEIVTKLQEEGSVVEQEEVEMNEKKVDQKIEKAATSALPRSEAPAMTLYEGGEGRPSATTLEHISDVPERDDTTAEPEKDREESARGDLREQIEEDANEVEAGPNSLPRDGKTEKAIEPSKGEDQLTEDRTATLDQQNRQLDLVAEEDKPETHLWDKREQPEADEGDEAEDLSTTASMRVLPADHMEQEEKKRVDMHGLEKEEEGQKESVEETLASTEEDEGNSASSSSVEVGREEKETHLEEVEQDRAVDEATAGPAVLLGIEDNSVSLDAPGVTASLPLDPLMQEEALPLQELASASSSSSSSKEGDEEKDLASSEESLEERAEQRKAEESTAGDPGTRDEDSSQSAEIGREEL